MIVALVVGVMKRCIPVRVIIEHAPGSVLEGSWHSRTPLGWREPPDTITV